ncbi:MAG: site-2 protease family protein [Desulfobacteraceae bacterium]|jgi:Zn-dependent protease
MGLDVISKIAIWLVPVLFSIVVHEVAHGWMAYRLGDRTAKHMGRLTLNPIPHIDPLGTVILPVILIYLGGPVFGWAKPVPFNPQNFKPHVNIRKGSMWVALAGPGSNLILAFIASFVLVFLRNSIPLPDAAYMFFGALVVINIFLALLNLIPIPPLDGSKILWGFLPPKYDPYFMMLERYGFFIIVILLGTGALSHIVRPPFEFLRTLFLAIPQFLF